MNPTQRLLSYLNTYGVGIYKPINDVLKEDFPANENDDYVDFSKITQQVTTLLASLQKQGLIEYRIDGFFGSRSNGENHGYNDSLIHASITQKGTDSLSEPVTKVQYIGINYGVALPTPKEGIITSIGKFILKNIIAVIFVTLLCAYIIWKLGWNK